MAKINKDYFEETDCNEYGFYQYYQVCGDTHKMHPVCPQCKAMVMPNRGQGAICEQCEYEFNMECSHDYF